MQSPNFGNLLLRNVIIIVIIVIPENLVRLQLLTQEQCCQKWAAQHWATDGEARTRKISHVCVRPVFWRLRLQSVTKEYRRRVLSFFLLSHALWLLTARELSNLRLLDVNELLLSYSSEHPHSHALACQRFSVCKYISHVTAHFFYCTFF